MMEKNTFAERLTALREEKELTRQKVADDLGISRASLEYYEKGQRKPDIEVAAKIAAYYGVSTDYLVGFSSSRVNEEQNPDMKQVCDYLGISNQALKNLTFDFSQKELMPYYEKAMEKHMLHTIAEKAKVYRETLLAQEESLKAFLNTPEGTPERYDALENYKRTVSRLDYEMYCFQTLIVTLLKEMSYDEKKRVSQLKKQLPEEYQE